MVDLKPTNLKLRERSRQIFKSVCGEQFYNHAGVLLSCENARNVLDEHIRFCGSLKLAILVGKLGIPVDQAMNLLASANGNLRNALAAIQAYQTSSPFLREAAMSDISTTSLATFVDDSDGPFVLAVDGGGSRTAVVIASPSGLRARGRAGSSNIATCGVDGMIEAVSTAINQAIAKLPGSRIDVTFESAWIGLAGMASSHCSLYDSALMKFQDLLKLDASFVRLTGDSPLLSSVLCGRIDTITQGICLVAGTGSGAMAYEYDYDKGFVFLGKSGGWGSYLDEGSGYHVGLQAVRMTLSALDRRRISLHSKHSSEIFELSKLQQNIVNFLSDGEHEDQLLPSMVQYMASQEVEERDRKVKIADVTRLVFDAAFADGDDGALHIVNDAASKLVDTILPIVRERMVVPDRSVLIMSGSLLCVDAFRGVVLEQLQRVNMRFKTVEVVERPVDSAVDALLVELGRRYIDFSR
jgi:N-acetylmuramic acid 6-phosphate etherase